MAAAFARKSRICLFPYSSSYQWLCRSNSNFSIYFSTSAGNVKNQTLNDPQALEFLIEKYDFSPETASLVASVLARQRNPQKCDSFLSFFKESGFSNTQLEKIVRYKPELLSCSLEKRVKPKFKIFEDLGFSAAEITGIVASDPSVLYRSAINRIIPSLSVLNGLLGSNAQVAKFLTRAGWCMFKDTAKTMLPNIEFLKSCGVSAEQINRYMYTFPSLFLLNPERVRRCVHKVDEMGVERTSRLFIYAVGSVSTMSDESWELKLKTLQDLGFSEDDTLRVFRKAPLVLSVSNQKIKKVKEVLLETGKYDMRCIVNYSISLTCSVEKRYKPRLQVLKVLEKKGLIKKWPSLGTLCCTPNKIFFQKFVAPNINEVGDSFIRQTAFSGKTEMETLSE